MRTFKIPNELSLILIAGFAFAAFLTGMELPALGNHLLTALIVLVVGFGLFCTNVFGAGDVKILTAIALWFGWPSFLPCLIYVALIGGVLSVCIWALRLFARFVPSVSVHSVWLSNLAATETLKAPYGVAICIGTLLAFNDSPLFAALFALMA